jgi:putative glycosyltransferase
MKLSVVTTLYNSAPFVEEFHRRVSAAARSITHDYEIVVVDDGSPDNSLDIACAIGRQDSHIKVIELSRNFGHHKALMAGMDHAAGDLVFLIDIDLEEPPELLETFHNHMQREDCDVVFGFQERRKGGFIERQGGRAAWYLMDKLYSIKIPRNQCTVRLMRRSFVDALLRHRESTTVIGGLWVITGFHQLGVPITKGNRDGPSYTLLHRLTAMLNGMTSFSTAPLMAMVYMGMSVSFASFIIGLIVIIEKLLYNSAIGWASLIVSIWFVGGVVVFCLGVIGIYISHIFIETKHRPYVIVRKIHQSPIQ